MSSDAVKALQCETEFLAGVEANLESAKGKLLRGSQWQWSRHDDVDRLKGLMAESRNYDRELLKSLPANRRIVLHGYERRWWFGKRATGMAVGTILTPLRHFASKSDAPPPPIGLGELTEHVRQITVGNRVPQIVGVCSPTGFTEEARAARLQLANVAVVLIEPDGRGGWQTKAASESVDPRVLRLFDPESANQKVDRVRRLLEERSVDLLTGGLSASAVASELSLSPQIVRLAFERVTQTDPELRLAHRDGDSLLFRGAPLQSLEKRPMGVIDRIRQLFSGEGREVEKINLLAGRRAALAKRRDRIYEDIAKLELKEAEWLAQGKATKSEVPRRRLAAQLAQLRKDIARQNTTAAMLNQQINIISTDVHNLTLIQQGQLADLPASEELTENAVRAEEMLETLKADSELVGGLTTGLSELTTGEEELAILREFEGEEATEPRSHEAAKANSEPRASSRAEAQRHEGTKARSSERPNATRNQYRGREGAGDVDEEHSTKSKGDAEAT